MDFLVYVDQSESYSKTLWGIRSFNGGDYSDFRIFRKKCNFLLYFCKKLIQSRKSPKISILPDPSPISVCNIDTDKPPGGFGDLYGVFDLPERFVQKSHGYGEIEQEVELVREKT